MNLLRRREMLQASGGGPEWDYEWDYTKGLLDATGNGFEKITSGGSVSIIDTYLRFSGSSSLYTSYAMPTFYTTGVMEAEILTATNAQMQLYFGNGEYGVGIRLQTSANYKGIYLGTSLSTKLVTAAASTKYKVRLVLKGTTADVYVDDNLVLADEDVTTLTSCYRVYVTGLGTGGASQQSRLYSLKMKFNRIS